MTPSASYPLVAAAIDTGVRDPRVLAALAACRALVTCRLITRLWRTATSPAPLGSDQVTTQPSLVAAMVEALELTGEECVLEVGTGLGYRGVGRLAREVGSVERRPDLAAAANGQPRR